MVSKYGWVKGCSYILSISFYAYRTPKSNGKRVTKDDDMIKVQAR